MRHIITKKPALEMPAFGTELTDCESADRVLTTLYLSWYLKAMFSGY